MVDLLFDIDDYENCFKNKFLDDAQLLCEKILEQEEIFCDCEVSFSLVSMEEIQSINKRFRKIDKATDVLSFPQNSNEELNKIRGNKNLPPTILGDIIISYEKALIQSEEYNHSIERELIYLTCHSMYHLLGYDHIEQSDKEVMRRKEEQMLEKLGFSRDY